MQKSRAGRSLSPAKRKLLEARLSKAASHSARVSNIPEFPRVSRFPATSPQRRFWFIDELNPGNPAYNMHAAIDLDGDLDIDRLQRALNATVGRHEVLHSRFAFENGELFHDVLDTCNVDLRRHARSTFSEPESLLIRLVREPFSLSDGPLFRADLIELTQNKHVLLVVVHHIICDESSIAIIVDDVADSYATDSADRRENAPSSARFADYAQWQEERMRSVLERHLPYWKEALGGLDERTSVPVDSRGFGSGMATGRIVRRELDGEIVDKARELAAAENMTLLPIMVSVWAALLNRYTGNRDVAVGTPASLRTTSELEGTVGLFLNTLVLRTAVDPADSFRRFLKSVRETVIGAFSHQEVPLESVVEAVNPERVQGENPLFDTMIVQETVPEEISGFGDLAARRRWVDAGVCKLDLTLFFRETADGLLLSLEYDTRLYQQRRMEAVLDHYASLLKELVNDSYQPIGKAVYLGADELKWLEHCSAGRWQDVGETPTVAAQIDANLSRLDRQTAIVDRNGSVSYHELNRLVAGMVDALAATDRPPRCIVILLDRSRWAIGAMLAAWRAFACYVPLDPDYPAARIVDTLNALASSDLRDFVVVTTKQHEGLLADDTRRVLIDTLRRVSRSRHGLGPTTDVNDAAYAIFTSGSTGRPKGVVITHENLRVSTGARPIVYGNRPERFLLLSSIAFDSSVAGIFWTLTEGGTLVIADREQARDPREVARLVDEGNVTHTLMLPSLYELVLRNTDESWGQSLSTVIVAGESCPETLYRQHVARVPAARLYNEYGPTEATVWATVERIETDRAFVPIGSSIPSIQTFVVDEQMNPQAPGLPGELCLSGPALSPRYLGDGADNAFVEARVFGRGHRLYRTGDKVRLDPEGRILFLGRADNQVKVRGHRVELEEINAAIRGLGGVQDVATIFDADRQWLDAFVETDSPIMSEEEIARRLRELLPDYMVPQRVLTLDEFPRLPNGKLDRSSLPKPEPAHVEKEPDAEGYDELKAIWSRVLGVENPPADVSFFDLGGHSLLAARFLLEVNETFERRVLLAKMYELRTLRRLFEYLQMEEQDDLDNLLFPIRAEGRDRPLFAVRTYLKHVAPDLETGYPIYGLSHGDQAPEHRSATLEHLASRYRVSIQRRQPSGPYRIAGYSFGALLALEIAHQIGEAGESVERLILIDPPPPVPEGDVRFRARRIRKRIQKPDRLMEQISAASAQIGKNIKRFVTRQRYRIIRTMDRIFERRSRHDATKQAFADWSKRARQAYRHKPYDGNTLLILMGREGEETPDQQVARWDGILTGCLDVRVIAGPDDHVALMQPPWSSRVATAVNEMLDVPVRAGRASVIRSK